MTMATMNKLNSSRCRESFPLDRTNSSKVVVGGLASTMFATTLLVGLVLTSASVSAENTDVVDEINLTVPVSCTMSGIGMNSHNAEINNGLYNSAIGETTLKAFCNDANGFVIYAIGYTDNEDGKNVLTNSTLGSTHDIVTGTATSGDTSNWAMKLSTTTTPTPTYPIVIAGSTDDTEKESGDLDYSIFQQVPDDYTLVAKRMAGTDIGASAEGSTLKTTYQAYISKTQPAGTYAGQVKYTLVHPHTASAPYTPHEVACAPNTICYSANTNDALGSMGAQTISEADKKDWSSCTGGTDYSTYCRNSFGGLKDIESLPTYDYYMKTLYAPNYSRRGYGFAGWNDKYDYSGNNYGPNETININDEIAHEGLTLYAVWVEPQGYFQNWRGCSSLARNQVISLTDNRDGQTYAVAKLADDNCWMTENLRLDNSAILSPLNTNNPALPLINGYDDENPIVSNHLSATSSNWCSSGVNCVNQTMLNTDNTTLYQDNSTSNQSGNIYNYGNYYNWYSATAGNGTYSISSGDVLGDICPIGWKLPSTGESTADYNVLGATIGVSDQVLSLGFRAYPLNYVYSTYTNSYEVTNVRGTSGNYASSSVNNRVVYGLFINRGSVNLSWSDGKTGDWSVRCLLKPRI